MISTPLLRANANELEPAILRPSVGSRTRPRGRASAAERTIKYAPFGDVHMVASDRDTGNRAADRSNQFRLLRPERRQARPNMKPLPGMSSERPVCGPRWTVLVILFLLGAMR
jgi:hypothetical protein